MASTGEGNGFVTIIFGEVPAKCEALWEIALRFLPRCGDWRGDDGPDEPAMRHDCPRFATRLSIVYERAEVYVCDLDHEAFDPWSDDSIYDLPWAKAVRALPLYAGHRWLSGLSRPDDAAYHAGLLGWTVLAPGMITALFNWPPVWRASEAMHAGRPWGCAEVSA